MPPPPESLEEASLEILLESRVLMELPSDPLPDEDLEADALDLDEDEDELEEDVLLTELEELEELLLTELTDMLNTLLLIILLKLLYTDRKLLIRQKK